MESLVYGSKSLKDEEDVLPLNLCKSNGSRESTPLSEASSSSTSFSHEKISFESKEVSLKAIEPRLSLKPSILLTPIETDRTTQGYGNLTTSSAEALQLASHKALLELLALHSGGVPLRESTASLASRHNLSLPYLPFVIRPESPAPRDVDLRNEMRRDSSPFLEDASHMPSSSSHHNISKPHAAFTDNAASSKSFESSVSRMKSPSSRDGLEVSSASGDSKVKDARYYERRQRNNESARKSRERRREKEKEKEAKAIYLESQYNVLIKNLVHYSTLLKKFESNFVLSRQSLQDSSYSN
ncbi:uncharacterized protein LOC136035484 [Artemia franciscana]|uniref:BZIP domain-containing protein n=1 Tax=Artemia franciscana TaxID=6661 RepID=A0AA88L969_ARTSF|nr:hypothetical protein QYM36_003889 [Artemia franciscana]